MTPRIRRQSPHLFIALDPAVRPAQAARSVCGMHSRSAVVFDAVIGLASLEDGTTSGLYLLVGGPGCGDREPHHFRGRRPIVDYRKR